jgi:1-phosphatidylinositol-3-phosphate 5-kinase
LKVQKNLFMSWYVDYIRTFTWDKKLETMVKSSGILGGQGKLPTVVSPELYRARFIAAMHRYFLLVPDRWTGLGRGLDC